jgi:hypothetical protein
MIFPTAQHGLCRFLPHNPTLSATCCVAAFFSSFFCSNAFAVLCFFVFLFNFYLMAKQKIKELQAYPSAKKRRKKVGSYLT